MAEAQKLTPNIFPLGPKSEHCSTGVLALTGVSADVAVHGCGMEARKTKRGDDVARCGNVQAQVVRYVLHPKVVR